MYVFLPKGKSYNPSWNAMMKCGTNISYRRAGNANLEVTEWSQKKHELGPMKQTCFCLYIWLAPPLHCSDSPELGQILTSGVGGRVRFSSTTQAEFRGAVSFQGESGCSFWSREDGNSTGGLPRKFPSHRVLTVLSRWIATTSAWVQILFLQLWNRRSCTEVWKVHLPHSWCFI